MRKCLRRKNWKRRINKKIRKNTPKLKKIVKEGKKECHIRRKRRGDIKIKKNLKKRERNCERKKD